ncbi:hypothetical protein GF362_07620 [Candidatus Dojkabacteria bacterium]|nr:hypothetical protein [Candidatus Dojkabacteria bacterium]
MSLSKDLQSKFKKYKKQFVLIAPYKNPSKLIVFPHSGYTFFFNQKHRDIFNDCVAQDFKIGSEEIDYNFFKFLQETDIGFEHSVLPFLLSGKLELEKEILPKDTWALINKGHRITAGDVNRGCAEPQKIVPLKTFTGMQIFKDKSKHHDYSNWVIQNHVQPFQSSYLDILKENPSIEVAIHMHTLDPTSGFANIKTSMQDRIRPMAQLFQYASVYPEIHSTFFKNRKNEKPFEIEFLPSQILEEAKRILKKHLSKYYIGSKPKILVDSPYCMKGYKGVGFASLTAMHNPKIKQILVEANKAALNTDRRAGRDYLEATLKISSLL